MPRNVLNQMGERASGSGGSHQLDPGAPMPAPTDAELSDEELEKPFEGTAVPEGEWKPLPDKRPVVLESEDDVELLAPDPPMTLPAGKARRLAKRKKPTDSKLDEDDMPARGAFGLFDGGSAECKTHVVPVVLEN